MTSRDRDYQGQRGYGRDADVEREGFSDYRNQTSRDRGYARDDTEYGGYSRAQGASGQGYGGGRDYGDYRGDRDASFHGSRDRGEASGGRDDDFRRYNPYRGTGFASDDLSPGRSGQSAPRGWDRGMRQDSFEQSYGGRPQGYDDTRGWREQQGSLGYERGQGQGYGRSAGQGHGLEREGQHHGQAHDADYAQWRDEQVRNLDNDYQSWRQDRYKKFSDEFNTWRSSRAGKSDQSGSAHAGASSDKSSDKSASADHASGNASNTRK